MLMPPTTQPCEPRGQCTTTSVVFENRAPKIMTPQAHSCINHTNSISCLHAAYTGPFSDGATSCVNPAPPSSSTQLLMQNYLSD
ncbi:hypothetical protein ASPTUDRAFT_40711 [Aspergillus tubingensis CBS 134.48]|uniref:Uncharacterized protein n=1 Tax=Aspergillus tubingensis (strain CBS 134.48) TaxID=767770 RepID=A0A1L9N5S7_ASPTC|nr:hypothetical protein ASPTUDRAFT_40711 [Aspergillus tubingensis CBS 134.48]